MSKRKLKKLKLTLTWVDNQVGNGQTCTYFPFMKIYAFYDVFDVVRVKTRENEETGERIKTTTTSEVEGWKYLAYFCDSSYTSKNVYRTIDEAKAEAERYCYCVMEKLLEKVVMEGKNEHPEVQCETRETNSKGLEREAAIK